MWSTAGWRTSLQGRSARLAAVGARAGRLLRRPDEDPRGAPASRGPPGLPSFRQRDAAEGLDAVPVHVAHGHALAARGLDGPAFAHVDDDVADAVVGLVHDQVARGELLPGHRLQELGVGVEGGGGGEAARGQVHAQLPVGRDHEAGAVEHPGALGVLPHGVGAVDALVGLAVPGDVPEAERVHRRVGGSNHRLRPIQHPGDAVPAGAPGPVTGVGVVGAGVPGVWLQGRPGLGADQPGTAQAMRLLERNHRAVRHRTELAVRPSGGHGVPLEQGL